jgi:hypothetical protein
VLDHERVSNARRRFLARVGEGSLTMAVRLKFNPSLLLASAAVCLAWPCAGSAEEHHGETPGAHAPAPPSHTGGGQTHGFAQPAAPPRPAPRPPSNVAVHHAGPAGPAPQPGRGFESQTRPVRPAGGSFHAPAGSPAHAARPPAVAALRRNLQAPRRVQAGAYRPPQGYVARHWSYGGRLPGAYYARDYWLTDYWIYGLFAPPDGLVWVRVGDDALLIDEYTGEIIQVDYGVFY